MCIFLPQFFGGFRFFCNFAQTWPFLLIAGPDFDTTLFLVFTAP